MKSIFLTLFLIISFFGFNQSIVSDFYIAKRAAYQAHEKSPSFIRCDSLSSLRVCISAYKNGEPMANNDRIIWSAWIGVSEVPSPDQKYPLCKQLVTQKIYLFYSSTVHVYSFEGEPTKEAPDIYSSPEFIVIKYKDKMTNEVNYLRSNGFPPAGIVD